MPEEYPKEQLWALYEKLPEDLQEAIFSEKTADAIYNVCSKNGLEKETPQVAKYAGYVLLGLLTPDEFQKTLQEELKLKEGLAKNVSSGISRFVFFPVKGSLEALYKIEIEKPALTAKASQPEEKPMQRPRKDLYREPVE